MEQKNAENPVKLNYHFTMASGDIDWSDGVIDVEIDGKMESLAYFGTERKGLSYESLEYFAKLFCAAPEMRELLTKLLDQCTPPDLTKPKLRIDQEWLRVKELLKMLDDAENECKH